MAFDLIGPCEVRVGNFTGTPSFQKLRKTVNVSVDFGLQMAWTSADAQSGLPHADGIYAIAAAPTVQVQSTDGDLDQLESLILGHTKFENGAGAEVALGLPDEFKKIPVAEVPSVHILPLTEVADGIAAQHGILIPAATIAGLNGISFGRVQGGQEIQNPFTVNIQAAYRDTDQADAAIPAGARVLVIGDPAAVPLAWSFS